MRGGHLFVRAAPRTQKSANGGPERAPDSPRPILGLTWLCRGLKITISFPKEPDWSMSTKAPWWLPFSQGVQDYAGLVPQGGLIMAGLGPKGGGI